LEFVELRQVLGDDGVAVEVRVVHIELAVRLVRRMERQPEEAALAATGDPRVDVEERGGERNPIGDDLDPATLLHDELPKASVAGVRQEEGLGEAAGDAHEPEREMPRRVRRRGHGHRRLR
jgi:hypothetical protein